MRIAGQTVRVTEDGAEVEAVNVYECEFCSARWTEPNMPNCYSCNRSASTQSPFTSTQSLEMQNLKTGEGVLSSPPSLIHDTNAKGR